MRQDPSTIDPSFASDVQPGNNAESSEKPDAADPQKKAKSKAKAKALAKAEIGDTPPTGTVPKPKTAAQEAKSVLWFKLSALLFYQIIC